MIRTTLALAAVATATLVTTAGAASADSERCVTLHGGPFPTTQQCIWVPDRDVHATGSALAASSLPGVTVTTNNGGVQVGTSLPGQPLLSASADRNGVCVGFSYEEGTCIPVTIS
jgi:hypothetical protein